MRPPKESGSQLSEVTIEKAAKYWRELLAVGLCAVAMLTLYTVFSPRMGLMDPNYSQGVYFAITERTGTSTLVYHSLQIGTRREFRMPDGQLVVPEGQPFISLQSCPVKFEDGRWITTACSVVEFFQSSS